MPMHVAGGAAMSGRSIIDDPLSSQAVKACASASHSPRNPGHMYVVISVCIAPASASPFSYMTEPILYYGSHPLKQKEQR
jgi:hypothetical protein